MLTEASELDRPRFVRLADAFRDAAERADGVAIGKSVLDFLYANTRCTSMSRGEWEHEVRVATALDENLTRFGSGPLLKALDRQIDKSTKAHVIRQLTSVPAVLAVGYHGGFSVPRRRLFARWLPSGVVIGATGKHAARDGAVALFAAREAILCGNPVLMAPDGRFGKDTGTITVLGVQLPVTDGAPFLAYETNCAVTWFALVRAGNEFSLATTMGPRREDRESFADFRRRFYRFYADRLQEAFTGDPSNLPLSANWKLMFSAMLSGKVYRVRRPTR